ncbi:MAG TPA: hypothetical protein VH143_16020 [Kofleriaceae bacterium]|nr:hypothetical protein [Kofleriaceae bacterium]
MLLFRSLAIGLLGACCLLLAMRPPAQVVERERVIYRAAPPPATLIDVAAGVSPTQLGGLVKLQPDEHVTEIDDRPVSSDLDAGAILAQLEGRPAFVDLELDGGVVGHRRVVLLLH